MRNKSAGHRASFSRIRRTIRNEEKVNRVKEREIQAFSPISVDTRFQRTTTVDDGRVRDVIEKARTRNLGSRDKRPGKGSKLKRVRELLRQETGT